MFNRILYEREYKRRRKNGEDLGVRIQNLRFSDPTANTAIENMMIREAIEDCNFSGDSLKDTDDPEKHKRDILTLHRIDTIRVELSERSRAMAGHRRPPVEDPKTVKVGFRVSEAESARGRTDVMLIPIRIRNTTDKLYMRLISSAFVKRNNRSEETLRMDWIPERQSALQSIR